MQNSNKKVLFINCVTLNFSKKFLLQLHRLLLEDNIEFYMASGASWKNEAMIDVLDELPFRKRLYYKKLFNSLYYASGIRKLSKKMDLVIIEQSNSALHCYLILFHNWVNIKLQKIFKFERKQKVAYWGHGETFVSHS